MFRTYLPIVETLEKAMDSPKFRTSALSRTTEKPDSQLPDKIKDDEVSSSEEAFKSNRCLDNVTKEGKTYISNYL